MRIAIAALLVLTACGSWSNEDLEYLYALPQKDTLKSKLDGTGNTASQGLSVGDPSKTYDDLKKTSDDFNASLDMVLNGLDAIRQFPPTTRQEDARIWGPYPDDKHKGFDVQVEIHREQAGAQYSWAIKMRPRNGEFFTLAGGTYKPTKSLREGQGTFFLDGKADRDNLHEGDPNGADRADFRYSTDTDPVIVELDLTYGAAVRVGLAFNGHSDKSAALAWVAVNPANTDASKVSYAAGWTATTAGRADLVVLEGKYATATGIECWDQGHIVVYAKGYSDAGPFEIGNAADCAYSAPVELKAVP